MEERFLRPEKSSKRNYLVKSASDDHSVFLFYMGLAHTSGVKASIIEAVNVFIAILVAGFCFIRKRLHQEKSPAVFWDLQE